MTVTKKCLFPVVKIIPNSKMTARKTTPGAVSIAGGGTPVNVTPNGYE
jgi:hypothetical protein